MVNGYPKICQIKCRCQNEEAAALLKGKPFHSCFLNGLFCFVPPTGTDQISKSKAFGLEAFIFSEL
jgi:hypothetical protein